MGWKPKYLIAHDYGMQNVPPTAKNPYNALVYPSGKVRYRNPESPYTERAPHAYKMNPYSVGLAYAGPVGSTPTRPALEALRREAQRVREMYPGIEMLGHGEAYKKYRGTNMQASKLGRGLNEASWRTHIIPAAAPAAQGPMPLPPVQQATPAPPQPMPAPPRPSPPTGPELQAGVPRSEMAGNMLPRQNAMPPPAPTNPMITGPELGNPPAALPAETARGAAVPRQPPPAPDPSTFTPGQQPSGDVPSYGAAYSPPPLTPNDLNQSIQKTMGGGYPKWDDSNGSMSIDWGPQKPIQQQGVGDFLGGLFGNTKPANPVNPAAKKMMMPPRFSHFGGA